MGAQADLEARARSALEERTLDGVGTSALASATAAATAAAGAAQEAARVAEERITPLVEKGKEAAVLFFNIWRPVSFVLCPHFFDL